MAVGKGSMERAAKAAESKTMKKSTGGAAKTKAATKVASAKAAPVKTAKAAEKKPAAAKNTAAKAETVKAAAEPVVSKVTAAQVIAAPSKEVMGAIIYQPSNGMLERAAEPNERFGLGDDMPVYYF
ncbi:MAG: hypothetical protein IJ873_06845 [Lachnospiraceae bacterium]|nr:hypothetical protein [Lachnospiraceae bacterium]